MHKFFTLYCFTSFELTSVALQEDEKLKNENYILRGISRAINERIRSKDITYINDGMDLEGELKFDHIEETQ